MTFMYFIAGLLIFLYAMHSLERGLRRASGENLKRWLALRTQATWSAVFSGVVVTAILQSSSMVSLVLLALLSAEVISLMTAIGVILGANLGTTLTGWVVAVVGFKLDFQALVIPLLGVGAACQLLFPRHEKIRGLGLAIFAFGLLVFGLDQMKTGVAGLPDLLDLDAMSNLPALAYLGFGLALAAIMQSSSAVMVITLAMLSAGLLPLAGAAAMVIGADLGTTSTTVLGSLGDSRIKKQLAFAHVFFNVLTNLLAFVILLPLLPQLLDLFGIQDPLFGLVAFHSTFNLIGIVLFLPILRHYTRWIERLIPAPQNHLAEYFSVPIEVPDAAIKALSAALKQLVSDAVRLNVTALQVNLDQTKASHQLTAPTLSGSFDEQYQQLKGIEDGLIQYASKLQASNLTQDQRSDITEISQSARAMVYATKTLKDVNHDLRVLRGSSNSRLGKALGASHQARMQQVFNTLLPHWFDPRTYPISESQYRELGTANDAHREQANEIVAAHLKRELNPAHSISTWFNLNHELHHYVRYLLSVMPELEIINTKTESGAR